jgi:hypothetical protein
MKLPVQRLTAVVLTVGLAACGGHSSNVSTASSSAGPGRTGAPGATSNTVVVPAGTTFRGKLQQEISTKKDQAGDRFSIVASNGETVHGHLDNVHAAGLGKKPSMTMVFDDVTMPDGAVAAPIDVTIENMGAFGAKSHHLRTIAMMAGGALAGHMAAKKVGRKHGGLAGAAAAYVLSQEMKTDVDVKPGTVVVLKFKKDAMNSGTTMQ